MAELFSAPPVDYRDRDADASRYVKQLAALEQKTLADIKNLNTWRLITFSMAGIAAVATAGLLYTGSNVPAPAVYVVEVDDETGEPVRHQLIGDPLKPSEAMVSSSVGRWIQLTRAKSTDPVVIKDNWSKAYEFVPLSSKPQIDAYAQEVNAFDVETLGKEAITVDIASVTRQSADTFQVRWHETKFADGFQISKDSFTANIAVDFVRPTTPRQIQTNPLGLMITEIYVQPDFASAERPS